MILRLQASDARSVAAILAVFVMVVLGSSSARAESKDVRDDSDRWVPSLAVNLEFTIQSAKGTVGSYYASGAPFRPFADNDGSMISPNAGGSLEIMSPVVAPVRFAPRFFFDGEVYSVSNQRRTIAQEGDPTGLTEPANQQSYSVGAIAGQGSQTQVDLKNVAYGAGVGIAIPFEVGDYRVMVKPSARYMRRKYTFRGTVDQAFRPNVLGPSTLVELAGNDELEVDAVGPAIEFQVEAFKTGRIGASVFANVGAYKVLGDRSVRFTDSVTYQDPNLPGFQQTATGVWTGEVDPWIYRAGIGMRIKWMGFRPGWLGMGRSDSRSSD